MNMHTETENQVHRTLSLLTATFGMPLGIAIPGSRTIFQSRNPGIMRDQIPGCRELENNVLMLLLRVKCMH